MTRNNKLKNTNTNTNPNLNMNIHSPYPIPIIHPPIVMIPHFNITDNINQLGYMGNFKIVDRKIKPDNSVWNCVFNFTNGLFEWYFDGYYTPNVYYNMDDIYKQTSQYTTAQYTTAQYTTSQYTTTQTELTQPKPEIINNTYKSEYKPITLNEVISLYKESLQTQKQHKKNNTNLEDIKEAKEEPEGEAEGKVEGEVEGEDDDPPPLSYFENETEIFVN
jgi:hypothetical protein